MSTFKHMVSNDTDHVIFNLDELADLHEVDGGKSQSSLTMSSWKK